MNDIKQFKLSSGEQIICEILEWPDVDDDMVNIVVRNVFQIVAATKPFDSNRYYTFVPWLVFQDEENAFQIINGNHVVGEANPSQKMIKQYFIAVKGEASEDSETDRADIEKKLEDYMNSLRQMVDQRSNADSGEENVIVFPGGRTLH